MDKKEKDFATYKEFGKMLREVLMLSKVKLLQLHLMDKLLNNDFFNL